ncbi:MAG: type II toxin-antitoxin system PemK/MazF family toxin [Bacteroidales bacterium]|nr:type II toxin-antitoxin system PemK/MazF family toxin [Bacteroidales bacterium]MCF8343222.1 type II toxin-antitoxin system PemK/MazF family toxin [Bacteroidales bacterium]MCF8350875.1 type II toxin-antitoxin system PemK/MazF family toxin [Bacteroidales bacterium]MCF8374869.1 type II toxin-antitoxin system PemK/MazF family toxin [Bacteroidales bacterium]MCF8399727.1 type II toxin-antitoxin system PemK/MazF family toxin [Bacteroidales bacterium]
MNIKQFDVWIADLNPRIGTETGKTRPVLVVQTNLLNRHHPSTLICPLSTNIQKESKILRVHLQKGEAGLKKDTDILIDQIRAIDNRRFMNRIGSLAGEKAAMVKRNMAIVLDL